MYSAYIEPALKSNSEVQATGTISPPTIEALIEGSKMGVQNETVKENLKAFIITNKSSLIAIPAMTNEKEMLISTHRRRLAMRVGRIKAQTKRGEKPASQMVGRRKVSALKLESTRLKNLIRMTPFLAAFSKEQINRIQWLPYSISAPKVRKDGILTVRYRGKRITQKQLKRRMVGWVK